MKMERRAAGKESRYDDENYYKSEEERERERENENENENELMEVRRGPWTVEEDFTLINYIAHHGEGRWNSLSRSAGLKRTGKSCRLRWLNYLRPDVRRGNITLEEQLLILELHSRWGNRWSKIAQHLPGRTDNEIKNYWRTRVQKHAKQLKCDVNSKQFKDTMRYLWMPRLIDTTAAADDHTQTHLDIINTQHQHHHHHPLPDNTCPDALPDNSASPPPAYYNNINCNQHHLSPPNHTITYGDHHSLTTDYFNQPQPQPQPQPAFDFSSIHQNSTQLQWIGGGGDAHDASNNLWNIVDDIWFSHNCHL